MIFKNSVNDDFQELGNNSYYSVITAVTTVNAFSFLELHSTTVTTCYNGQFTFLSPPPYFRMFSHCIPITWNCDG